MKKTSLFAALAAALFATSCEPENQLPSEGVNRVYKVVWDASGTNDDIYGYDAQGRVVEIGSPDGSALRFAYEADKITQTEGDPTGKIVYTLGTSYKVVSFANMNGDEVVMAGELTYDSDGRFKEGRSYFPSDGDGDETLYEYTWEEGNVTAVTHTSGESNSYIMRHTFYADQPNDGPMDFNSLTMDQLSEVWFGEYFGLRSKNLVHTSFPDSGGPVTTFRYVRDADGNVSEIWSKEDDEPEKLYCKIEYRKIF